MFSLREIRNYLNLELLERRGDMCYTYVTVFVRNAANLAHILPKASKG
jgi:hypothetical protein